VDNATLNRRAEELEGKLQPKLKCYMTVGWVKQDKSVTFVVYYDQRKGIRASDIPAKWYGFDVKRQKCLPPGVRPSEAPGPAW
jgi:hypothetical protein